MHVQVSSATAARPVPPTQVVDLDDLPYSSDKERIYVLPEEDITELFGLITAGVDPDEVLLQLWSAACRFDLDVLAEEGEDMTLSELVAAVPEVDKSALHAIVFTYSSEESSQGEDIEPTQADDLSEPESKEE